MAVTIVLNLGQFSTVMESPIDGWTRVKEVVGVDHISNTLIVVMRTKQFTISHITSFGHLV